MAEAKEQDSFIVAIKYNSYTRHFFIDFVNEKGCLISVLVSEGAATGVAKALGLKIMYG